MAITLIQNGADLYCGAKYPHSFNMPALFTCSSDIALNYIDFKFVFKIYNDTGLIITKFVSLSKDLIGIFNASNVVKSLIDSYDVQENTTIESIKNIIEYKVTVQEYYEDALQGIEIEYDKSLASNLNYNQCDSLFPYIIENEKYLDFYTNQISDIRYTQSKGTRGSFMLPNSSTINGVAKTFDNIDYAVKIWSGTTWKIMLYQIPTATTYTFLNTNTTVNDSINATIKTPIGFATLLETTVNRVGYIDTSGQVSDIATGILFLSGETYDTVEYLNINTSNLGVVVSPTYTWSIDNCANKDITVVWKNVYGGTELFPFDKVRSDKITNNKDVFEHNSLYNESNSIFNNTQSTNKTVFNSNKGYNLRLRTANINKNHIQLLKGLWHSNEVGVYIDNNFYPVTDIASVKEIPSKERIGFVSYVIELNYSKILK